MTVPLARSPATVLRSRRMVQMARAVRRRSRLMRVRAYGGALLLAAAGLALFAAMLAWPEHVSWALYGPLVVVAGLFLVPRHYVVICALYAACLGIIGATVRGWSLLQLGTLVALALITVVMGVRTWSRERLGIHGNVGDDMLVDLRDRLRDLGSVPPLPPGWHAECAIRSAYGDKFSGDFAVTTLAPDGRLLETVLVDLSGKGRRAGTRSLLLSGAIGGLLGQLPPQRLLAAANSYLLRQGWDESFASAVHLALDLHTGEFSIGNAGHPGPVQFQAGSGRWLTHTPLGGPVLGILPDAEFPRRTGRLARGDALMLFTDGVIEVPGHDLDTGADRLVGAAERLVTTGLGGGARALCAAASSGETDDRAVLLLWRD